MTLPKIISEHLRLPVLAAPMFLCSGPGLVIEGRCPAKSPASVIVDPVAKAVMMNTVDSFDVARDGDDNLFRLTKHSPGSNV